MSSICRVILETDPATIAGRVAMRGADSDLPLTEQVGAVYTAIVRVWGQHVWHGLCALSSGVAARITKRTPCRCTDAFSGVRQRQGAAHKVAAEVRTKTQCRHFVKGRARGDPHCELALSGIMAFCS